MGYVIYHIETTIILGGYGKYYKSERSAKCALTKAENTGEIVRRDKYAITNTEHFFSKIEKKREVTNLMTKEPYMEGVNTPVYLSPACETYWTR